MSAEMWISLIGLFINGIVAVTVAVISVEGKRNAKKNESEQKRIDARSARRAQEAKHSIELNIASCDMNLATLDYVVVLTDAYQGHQPNGNLEKAQDRAEKAQETLHKAKQSYQEFINNTAAEQYTKV